MSITYEIEELYYLMAKACRDSKEKNKLDKAYRLIQKDIENNSIDKLKYGLVCVEEAILSAKTYKLISELVGEEDIVVDCGCATGLQQVFFSKCKQYIGIDIHDTFIPVVDNAHFIQGDIVEVLNNLKVGENYVGISVLCGSVWDDVGKSIRDKFKRVIIL